MSGWQKSSDSMTFNVTRGADTLTLPAPWAKVQTLTHLKLPGEPRGSDLTVPRGPGAIPMRHLRGATTYRLRLVVRGDVDRTGAPAANAATQFRNHLDWLNLFCADITASPWTLSAQLVQPGAATLTAGVRLSLSGVPDDLDHLTWGFLTLAVAVPAGRFS